MTQITEQTMREQPRRDQQVRQALALAMAQRLRELPRKQWVPLAQANLDKIAQASSGPLAQRWIQDWHQLLLGSLEDLLAVYLSDSEYGHDMRQMSPFAGLLSDQERMVAIAQSRRSREPRTAGARIEVSGDDHRSR